MKRILTRAIPILLVCVVLCGSMTALAADLPEATAPPYITGTEQTGTNLTPDPAEATAKTETPSPEPTPTPVIPALYPATVYEFRDNGGRQIVKSYELSPGENPEGISRDSFTRDGWRYTLTDITRKETAAASVREHIEPVTIDTETKDMEAILAQLAPTLEYRSEDGYIGILQLDVSTIKTETAGTKNSSYTVSATREYPHLSRNDTALVPHSITDNGRTLTLQSVTWKAQNTETIDYTQLPESYTAIATYTTTGTKTTVTGYTTTAEYKGSISMMIEGKTVYSAYFEGKEISPPTPAPTSTPEPTPKPEPEPEQTPKTPINPLPIVAALILIAGLTGGLLYFLFIRRNVKVFNLHDGKYAPVGRVRIAYTSPVINLTPFADKAATGSFILVLDKMAAKKLSSQVVTVNYGEKSFQHIVESDGGEYQFEVDF